MLFLYKNTSKENNFLNNVAQSLSKFHNAQTFENKKNILIRRKSWFNRCFLLHFWRIKIIIYLFKIIISTPVSQT